MTDVKARKPLNFLPAIFDSLSDSDKLSLKQTGAVLSVSKGTVLATPGETFSSVVFLLSGWCSVSVDGAVTDLLAPGSVFMSTLRDSPVAWAELAALSNLTIITLDRETLLMVFESNPKLVLAFLKIALWRLSRVNMLYALKGAQPLEHRLADLLWFVGTPCADGTRAIPASLTQTVLASLLGAPREEVNRKRKLLVRTGYMSQIDHQWYLDSTTPLLLSNLPGSLTGRLTAGAS